MVVAILNFHGVGPVRREISTGELNCWLDQDFFEAVLDVVCKQPNVRLTVDDGNSSDVEMILPALLRRGLRATFFLCSGRLEQSSFLNRDQVRQLWAHGMGIGSHGVAHVSWRHLSPQELYDELEGSRRTLEDVCGTPVEAAACPFGDYDRFVLNGLRRAGYRRVYTSDGGTASEARWLQARTTVTQAMTLESVERLVRRRIGFWKQGLIEGRKFLKRLR